MAGRRFGRAINKYIEQGVPASTTSCDACMQHLPSVIDLRPATREALFTFASQADLDRWDVFTDRTLGIGGTSTAELARCPDNEVRITHNARHTHTHTHQAHTRSKLQGLVVCFHASRTGSTPNARQCGQASAACAQRSVWLVVHPTTTRCSVLSHLVSGYA